MPPVRGHGANALVPLVHSQHVSKGHHMQTAHRQTSVLASEQKHTGGRRQQFSFWTFPGIPIHFRGSRFLSADPGDARIIFPMDMPTPEGVRRYPETEGWFTFNPLTRLWFEPMHAPCICMAQCANPCKGRCGCMACLGSWAEQHLQVGIFKLGETSLG